MKKLNILRLLSTVSIAAAGVFGVVLKREQRIQTLGAGDKVRVTIIIDDPTNAWWCDGNAITAIGCSDNASELYRFSTRDANFSTTTIRGNTTLWSEFDAVNPGSGWSGTFKGTTALIDKSIFGTTWGSLRFSRINPNSVSQAYNTNYAGSRADLLDGNQNTYKISSSGSDGSTSVDSKYFKVTLHDGENNTPRYFLVASTGAYYPEATSRSGYTFDGWYTTPNFAANSRWNTENWVVGDLDLYAHYHETHTSNFYAYGDFQGDTNWDIDTAKMLTPFSESSYDYSTKITAQFNYGDQFKICYWNDGTGDFDLNQEFGCSAVQNDSPAKFCFDLSRQDNVIQCYASGRYTIILHNFKSEGKTIYINFESSSRTAEQLAAYLMSFGENPSSGHCGDADRFPAARTMYLTQLSTDEKSTFQGYVSKPVSHQFYKGYKRYIDWAAALKQDPWSNNSAGVNALIPIIQNNNSIMIIVIISVVSVGAIGGYFFYKRRKEN